MGAILLIQDDRNFRSILEKIFPQDNLKNLRALTLGKESYVGNQGGEGPPSLVFEEIVRGYLREQLGTESNGSIHEHIIGKVEKALIGLVLEEEKGNQVRAAKRLGINRNTLRKKMKELCIRTRVVTG
jgi:DNA-binding protein Fis